MKSALSLVVLIGWLMLTMAGTLKANSDSEVFNPPCFDSGDLPNFKLSSPSQPEKDAEKYRDLLKRSASCAARNSIYTREFNALSDLVETTPFVRGTSQVCNLYPAAAAIVPAPYDKVNMCSSWPFKNYGELYGMGYLLHELFHVLQEEKLVALWKNSDPNLNTNINGIEMLYECQAEYMANVVLISAWGYKDFLTRNPHGYFVVAKSLCENLARQNTIP